MENLMLEVATSTVLLVILVTVQAETSCYSCLHFELTSPNPNLEEMLRSANLLDPNCLAEEDGFSGKEAKKQVCEFQCYKETGRANLFYLNEHDVELKVTGRGCTVIEKQERCTVGEIDTEHERFKDMVAIFQELNLCYCEADLCNGSPKTGAASPVVTTSVVILGWTLFYLYNV